MRRLPLAVLFLLAGCNTYDLPERWRPLEQIVERPSLPFVGDQAITTTGPRVWVRDLDAFLRKTPPGSVYFEGLLRHEQAHAIRQGGIPSRLDWERRYVTDVEFMWQEEQVGWWFEIHHLATNGYVPRTELIARALASYKSVGGDYMVSEKDAFRWIEEVLGGGWRPPEDLIEAIEEAHSGK